MANAAARSAECKGRADDDWVADPFHKALGFFHVMNDVGIRYRFAEFIHQGTEQIAVFRFMDSVQLSPQDFNIEFFQNSRFIQFDRHIEAGLPAKCRKQCIRALFSKDAADKLQCNRLDIHLVGDFGIGHDRRRIRVDQDNAVALFFQGEAGLCARIVEFCCLADNDRT